MDKREYTRGMDVIIVTLLVVCGGIAGWLSTSGFKSQNVRLLDVFVLGPLMVYSGYLLGTGGGMYQPNGSLLLGAVLIVFGASTITYNYKNYLANES